MESRNKDVRTEMQVITAISFDVKQGHNKHLQHALFLLKSLKM